MAVKGVKVGWILPDSKVKKTFEDTVYERYGKKHTVCGLELEKAMVYYLSGGKTVDVNELRNYDLKLGLPSHEKTEPLSPLEESDEKPDEEVEMKPEKSEKLGELEKLEKPKKKSFDKISDDKNIKHSPVLKSPIAGSGSCNAGNIQMFAESFVGAYGTCGKVDKELIRKHMTRTQGVVSDKALKNRINYMLANGDLFPSDLPFEFFIKEKDNLGF